MKRIDAIIRTSKFEKVAAALNEAECPFFTYFQVMGIGNQKGKEQIYRGHVVGYGSIPRTKIEIVLPDHMVEKVIQAILTTAQTGELGDGKIFVSNVEEAYRIRNAETGDHAI